MLGKQKCRILKEIRRKIAEENDIPYVTRECGFQGECKGTCPRCESELRELERQLEARRSLGKRVSVAALCAGMLVSTVGCAPFGEKTDDEPSGRRTRGGGGIFKIGETPEPSPEVLQGEIAYPDDLSGYVMPDDVEVTPEPLTGEEDVLQGEPVELTGDVAETPDEG
ncbi:MAG: hypothetical protein K6G17_05425 [Oscillospiraceae bacterium]|nr:hypothetical protein [Oscillospiraceae bacterium]